MGLFFNTSKARGLIVSAMDDILEASRRGGYVYNRAPLESLRSQLSVYLPTKKTFIKLSKFLSAYTYDGVGQNGSEIFVCQAVALMRNQAVDISDTINNSIEQLSVEIRLIEDEIRELTIKIHNALDRGDKNCWCLHKKEKDGKERILQIKQRSLIVLLQKRNNIAVANELRNIERLSSKIAKADNIVDMVATENSAETLEAILEEIAYESKSLDELVSFEEDDFEFQRAREEYLLQKNKQNGSVADKKAVKGKV